MSVSKIHINICMPLVMARILNNFHEFMRTYAGAQRHCYLENKISTILRKIRGEKAFPVPTQYRFTVRPY